jgi:hypothetical protein
LSFHGRKYIAIYIIKPEKKREFTFPAKFRLAPESWTNHKKTELPMTNPQWQILDFRPRVPPRGVSELKIGD